MDSFYTVLNKKEKEKKNDVAILNFGVLVSAWLNTSKDAIVGNEQKADTFWKRVAAYYGASPGVKDLLKREWNTCKQRWGKINEAVLRFCGCYDHAQRQTRSGQSEDDIMEMAYTLYSQDQKASFTLEHAWRMLRHDQKWCCMISQKVKSQSKRVRLDDSGAHSPISNTFSDIGEQTMERPIGVKASKAKVKKGGKATDEGKEDSVNRLESVCDQIMHHQLKADLVEHIWQKFAS